jgi:hypothetical protein
MVISPAYEPCSELLILTLSRVGVVSMVDKIPPVEGAQVCSMSGPCGLGNIMDRYDRPRGAMVRV